MKKSIYSGLKKSWKKSLSMGLVLCVLGMSAAGCGKTAETTETAGTTGTDVQVSEESGKEKITIALQANSFITDYDDNYLTKKAGRGDGSGYRNLSASCRQQ